MTRNDRNRQSTLHTGPGLRLACFLGLALLLFGQLPAAAGWENGDWAEVFTANTYAESVQRCPDGQGGMIVGMVDAGSNHLNMWLSRIDHTGSELWGEGGVALPVQVGADGTSGPMDIAPDGMGGVYCAFQEFLSGLRYVRVAHVNAEGGFDWMIYVAEFGDPGAWALIDLKAEATGDGDMVVVWTQAIIGAPRLVAARVNLDGAVAWEREIGPGIWLDPYLMPSWQLARDGQGGILLTFTDYTATYAQRIDGAGNLLWGVNSHALHGNFSGIVPIVHDGAGGAFVAHENIGTGVTQAQHLNASGNETWASGGVVVLPYASAPVICTDKAGGFYMVESIGDIVAQRVGPNAGLPWGAAGLVVASQTGVQEEPCVAPDMQGGLLIGYTDWYFVPTGGSEGRMISGLRLDAFGNTLWSSVPLSWAGWSDEFEPRKAQVLPDLSGGAMYVWNEFEPPGSDDIVVAMGVNAAGGEPLPTLTVMMPDAGMPGHVQPVLINGDYLEPGQEFKLQADGAPDLVIYDVFRLDMHTVEGVLEVGDVPLGAYDLVVSMEGVPADTLPDAFGVGFMPFCEEDEQFETHQAQALTFGSKRKAAFDSAGDAHMAWLEYFYGDYLIYWWSGNETGEGYGLQLDTPDLTRELTFTLGPDDSAHMAWVQETAGQEFLHYWRYEEGAGLYTDSLAIPDGVSNPVLAVDNAGIAHIVYEGDIMGASWLFHVKCSDQAMDGPYDIMSGAGATEPDLAVHGDGLMLTFVRNHWFPGLREVCYQRSDGEVWDVPVSLYFGIFVYSPAVAWDRHDKLLFTWILDNTGSAPLLHTCLMEGDTPGPVRWRVTSDIIYRTSVDAAGEGLFYLLTQESQSGIPMEMFLRSGDGNVFYPKRRLNSSDDVDLPFFAVQYGGPGLAVWWEEYDDTWRPYDRYLCFDDGSTPVEDFAPRAQVLGAYPNPFNPNTTLSYALAEAGPVKLAIYDVSGRLVRTLVDGLQAAGSHEARWDGRNDDGAPLAAGIYFARLRTAAVDRASKLVLLK